MNPLGLGWRTPGPVPIVQWTGRELLALRAWHLVRWHEDGGLRLQSLSLEHVWHGPVFQADRRPEPHNCHGVYAIKCSARPRLSLEPDWLTGQEAWIWGWVALSGRVIEHREGYRAERAVIRRLRLGVQTHLRCREYVDLLNVAWELESRYQCPVTFGYYEPRKAQRIRSFLEATRCQLSPVPTIVPDPVPVEAEPVRTPPPGPSTPTPAPVPPPAPPRPRKTQPVGTSAHGLEFAAVVRAFAQAEQEMGRKWRLKGRGHERRVTLDGRYSRYIRPATRSWRRMWAPGGWSRVVMFPLALVLRAAQILGVKVSVLIAREY